MTYRPHPATAAAITITIAAWTIGGAPSKIASTIALALAIAHEITRWRDTKTEA